MPPERPPRLLVAQHDADKGLGLLESPLRDAGLELDVRLAGRDRLALEDHAGVVALPGLANPDETTAAVAGTRSVLADALGRGLPVLGICLGAELLAQAAGADAYRCEPEYGFCRVALAPASAGDPLLGGLPAELDVFQAHAFAVSAPEGAVELAHSERALQAFRLGDRAWGIQFHPEPTLAMLASWIETIRDDMERSGVAPAETAALARGLSPVAARRASAIAGGFAAAVHAAGAAPG